MAITPLSGDHGSGLTTSKGGMLRKNWDVIIEDLSSDSSDGHESPQMYVGRSMGKGVYV